MSHASNRNRRTQMETLESRVFLSAAPAPSAAELAVAQANNTFALNLLKQLPPDSSGNVFFSPYSADTAMEMALQGAKGETATQIIQALDLPSTDLAQAGIQALNQLFQANASTAGYTLSTANRLWVNENFPLLESFITGSQNTFGAAPQNVDFSNPQAAAATINAWVSAQTDGKITNLISPDDLSALTSLVITNAVYFKANWADPFEAELTHSASFQTSSTDSATVQMMQETDELGYYSQSGPNGFQAVDLSYQGNDLDMMVILPTTNNLAQFQSTLTPTLFSKIAANLARVPVEVDLPKFQLTETYNLIAPLESLGIKNAFSSSANFSGISNVPMYISDVVQQSYIQVNETGTEAAAATGVFGVAGVVTGYNPPPISFDADHPFLFAIRDAATNTILFLGSVSNPGDVTGDAPSAPQLPIILSPAEIARLNDPLPAVASRSTAPTAFPLSAHSNLVISSTPPTVLDLTSTTPLV
jgi:serpin B